VRSLLTAKENKPSRLDELQAQLCDAEKQGNKLAKLIFGDDDPPAMLYQRLKQEQARAKTLACEIEQERTRITGESPILESYLSFCATLADKAQDKAYRPQLKAAIASVVESIMLDPQGVNRQWSYTVQLKGHGQPVEVVCTSKPESWLHRSLRPAQFWPELMNTPVPMTA
jgi:hypothetical protein